MDGGHRRWVLKPLSPVLQPSDLRIISSGPAPLTSGHLRLPQEDEDSAVVEAIQVSVSQDGSSSEEWVPSSPSSDGSLSGFYSFVEDPDSPEAGLNQAWMVSAQRRAQLATLKEGQGFTLQTYSGSRRPESLFPEGDQDCRYRSEELEPMEGRDEEIRQEIIHSQAPRRSPEGLSELEWKNQVIGSPENIDKEQINFTVARQQFLKMEEEQLRNVLGPSRLSRNHLRFSSEPDVFTSRTEVTNQTLKDVFNSTHSSQSNISPVSEELQDLSVNRTSISSCDTPIEQEIRRALQREESLRFSRGLKLGDGPSEMIQIRRKPFSSPLTPIRPRDKSRVSFMFQRDFQNQRAGPQENHEQVHERKDSYLVDKPSTAEKLQPEHGGLSHHRHFKDYELNSMPSGEQLSSSLSEGSGSWHSNMESSGLMFRKSPATDYIQKEIQDVLKREKELSNLCRSENKIYSFNAGEQRTRRTTSSLTDLTPPPLTNQLSERHRVESRYAGIHPVDDINNKVVESTRVVRHKNQRALRWEAGVFANQENQEENQ